MIARAGFNRRIFDVPAFKHAVQDALAHRAELRAAFRGGRVDRAFTERIMLAVTQVNGCRYCSYGHTRMALRAGVSREEVERLAAGSFDGSPPEQAVALLFAQHYAESAGRHDPAAWQQVVDTYGADTARDVMACIRMITLGNLWGNTLDALLSRLVGRPAPGSSLWQELGVLLGGVVFVPASLLRRRAGVAS